jgi:hypothetical protein
MARNWRAQGWRRGLGALGLAAMLAGLGGSVAPPWVFRPSFARTGLVSNEVLDRSAAGRAAPRSADWLVTSGSLFGRDGMAWTGPPDDRSPGPGPDAGTGSAVFRVVTRRTDFADIRVRVQIRLLRLVRTHRTPARRNDGIDLFLRYHSPQSLYVVSLVRRDGQVTVSRKTPGGPSNGGTYHQLDLAWRPPDRTWLQVQVEVRTLADGSVAITAAYDGSPVLGCVDRQAGPLRGAGGIGFRGDNAEFLLRDLVVQPL